MEWISVKDRLPTSMANKVLVYCKCGYIGFGHYEKYDGVETWYNLESQKTFQSWATAWNDVDDYDVTHWMELPESPKDDGRGE